MIEKAPGRGIIMPGNLFLRHDPEDRSYRWSLWRRDEDKASRCDTLVVNWRGLLPNPVEETTRCDGVDMEARQRFHVWECDQELAASIEMAARLGINGDRWFALIEKHIPDAH